MAGKRRRSRVGKRRKRLRGGRMPRHRVGCIPMHCGEGIIGDALKFLGLEFLV